METERTSPPEEAQDGPSITDQEWAEGADAAVSETASDSDASSDTDDGDDHPVADTKLSVAVIETLGALFKQNKRKNHDKE
jgi:hypothetical protein